MWSLGCILKMPKNIFNIIGETVEIQIDNKICLVDLDSNAMVGDITWYLNNKNYALSAIRFGEGRKTILLH